ncbi:MAG: DUF2203 domain-containing protein [Chlorobi bacterium]|nr:DUF2203 domain-containing protein [Chlorobiota bacterium]
MAYLHAIHFSLEEAQSMLAEVIPIVENIRNAKRRLDEIGYDIRGHHFFAGMGTNGTKPYPDEVSKLIKLFRGLTTKGILVKDMDRGLIDFPAIRPNGDEVYLCYMLGEKTIEYWHGIEDGFSGRQHVDSL